MNFSYSDEKEWKLFQKKLSGCKKCSVLTRSLERGIDNHIENEVKKDEIHIQMWTMPIHVVKKQTGNIIK